MQQKGFRWPHVLVALATVLVCLARPGVEANAAPTVAGGNGDFRTHKGCNAAATFCGWTACPSFGRTCRPSTQVYRGLCGSADLGSFACVQTHAAPCPSIVFTAFACNGSGVNIFAGIHVKGCLSGLTTGCNYRLTFSTCGAPCFSVPPSSCVCGNACGNVDICIGGSTHSCRTWRLCPHGKDSLCICGAKTCCPAACRLANCFDTFSLDFTASGPIETLKFAEEAHVFATFDTNALAVMDPHLSVALVSSATGAPEVDDGSLRAPTALLLAVFAVLGERRRRAQ